MTTTCCVCVPGRVCVPRLLGPQPSSPVAALGNGCGGSSVCTSASYVLQTHRPSCSLLNSFPFSSLFCGVTCRVLSCCVCVLCSRGWFGSGKLPLWSFNRTAALHASVLSRTCVHCSKLCAPRICEFWHAACVRFCGQQCCLPADEPITRAFCDCARRGDGLPSRDLVRACLTTTCAVHSSPVFVTRRSPDLKLTLLLLSLFCVLVIVIVCRSHHLHGVRQKLYKHACDLFLFQDTVV